MKKAKVLKEIIESRISTYPKDFSGKKISHKKLEAILSSAEFAPNHKKTKPWRFQLFQGQDKLALGEELARAYQNEAGNEAMQERKVKSILEKFDQTDSIITISVHYSGKVPQWEELAATAMAVQNMYLTCEANKVGCYWSSPSMIEKMEDYLGLAENERCIGLFFMGRKKKEVAENL